MLERFAVRQLLDRFDDPAYMVCANAELTIDGWNRAAEEALGWTAQEAIGRPVSEQLLPTVTPASRRRKIEMLRRRDWWMGETTLLDRDGRPVAFRGMCWSVLDGGERHYVTVLRRCPQIAGSPHNGDMPQIAALPQNMALHAKHAFARNLSPPVQAFDAMTAAAAADPVAQWISTNMRRLRRERGLSQEDLAIKLGKYRQHVSMWENGVHPTSINLQAIAEALDVPLSDLHRPPDDE